ncbi:hypothetical protein [Microbulbifer sp. 2205BS26-8]|uniref:hypothetical protein n=1 Tax=Microbulbifer sp. 2205BS26-8 TaxID=3064386 RepID=UPI00273E2102|nr:hypothetical protein [Microbulbifer sp. 2205BS26-8]MDP5209180.1 hypothetical protein [Microbulbifer sp. 2205BS26-8]
MSGRKNKHKHRGQQRRQPRELLDELSALHALLDRGDPDAIPLLNQVANPNSQETPAFAAKAEIPILSASPQPVSHSALPQANAQTDTSREAPSGEDVDLPILFSPLKEQLPEEHRIQLTESDLALLRPLQHLPKRDRETTTALALSAETPTTDTVSDRSDESPSEQVPETQPQAPDNQEVPENPFLPAHIRARLTGGCPPANNQAAPDTASRPETTSTANSGTRTQALVMAQTMVEREVPAGKLVTSGKKRQRQALVEQLVSQQLPELERQLRAQIEKVVDELGIWD